MSANFSLSKKENDKDLKSHKIRMSEFDDEMH